MIQALILVSVYKFVQFIMKFYSNVMETFQIESFTSVSNTSNGGYTPDVDVVDSSPHVDFNRSFDSIVDRPQTKQNTLDIGTDRIEHKSIDEHEKEIIEDYNHLQPGYTFKSPTMFRTPESQPPICLTDRPCQTQPVVISTSMGTEFLPYAKIKSSIHIEDDVLTGTTCSKSDPVLHT